jgi:hypothetical protein
MQINASMLHELRMVIQHASRLLRRAKRSNVGGGTLLCVTCLRMQNFKPTPAVTVTRGNAVCLAHLS